MVAKFNASTYAVLYVYCFLIPDLPLPLVNITTTGDSIAGESYSLQCSVSVVDYLVVQPDLKLVAANGSTVASQMNTTVLTHSFSPLITSDRGEYTCTATLTIPNTGIINLQNSATKTITVVGELMQYLLCTEPICNE